MDSYVSRWLVCAVGVLWFVWLIAACAPAMAATPPASTAPETEVAVTETLSTPATGFIPTPTPGPTPTPTPQPLPQPDPERAARLTREGEALFLESDLEGAESAFVEAIAADPSYLPAHIGLTRVYLYQPQYWQQALAAARAAEALAPDDPTVLTHLAWTLQSAHHFDAARRTALRAVELGPENALAHTALADILISVYEVDAAMEHARRAVELDEKSAEAWAVLGFAEYMQHNWDAATAAYDKAVALEPTFFAWHLLRARHELNITGDTFSARELAEPALESQPDHAWTLLFLADIAIEKRDWDAAEAACQRLMGLDQPHTPYPDPYTCMASVMLWQERYEEADHYQALAEERATPERRDVTLLRMRLYLDRDECQEARALAQDWLDERPYSVQAMRMMGLSYLCEEDNEKAVTYFRQAYTSLPRSVVDARLLAIAYARDDRASEAMAVLNEVKPFALEDPVYYQALYEVHLNLGNRRAALRAAQRWQVIRPDDTSPRVSIALAHLLLDNVAAARGAAESALADGEGSATLYAVLGEALHRQGEEEKAEEYMVRAVEQNPYHYLARNILASFYLASDKCKDALPHLRWLLRHTSDEEEKSTLARTVRICEQRIAPLPTPEPDIALEDDQAVEEARALVRAAHAEPRRVELTEVNEEWTLVVVYSTDLEAESEEFVQLERRLAMDLAGLLPRIVSLPEALVLVSGSGDRPIRFILVPTWATLLWLNGELTDEEFENTWQRQDASGLG